ncbi:hypothetical protein [Microcoleus sp.]|uniref:hypothetical protein n=1 Tax=Microcoleus sp. TaxID=44472 RepID=UPI003524AE26
MKAVCWHGANDVRVDNVPDPTIINPRDAIFKITSTAICGSDLHLLGLRAGGAICNQKRVYAGCR